VTESSIIYPVEEKLYDAEKEILSSIVIAIKRYDKKISMVKKLSRKKSLREKERMLRTRYSRYSHKARIYYKRTAHKRKIPARTRIVAPVMFR